MHHSDDLYLGGFLPAGLVLPNAALNPTLNEGVGPMGRIYYRNVVPLAASVSNIAALQHTVAATALTLTAGTGVTSTTYPGGSPTVLALDTARALSYTSSANMSAVSFTAVGYDEYWNAMTETVVGPNATTVYGKKAFRYITSVTASATDAGNNVSVGMADIFGMPFAVADGGYISPRWAGSLSTDTGTFVAADATTATATTGDVRGTFTPSSASNGVRRLVVWMHLTGGQCGPTATSASLFGVTQA